MSIENVINETVEARVREAYEAGRKVAFVEAVAVCDEYATLDAKDDIAWSVAREIALRIERAKRGTP